jgi:hypothetical protein
VGYDQGYGLDNDVILGTGYILKVPEYVVLIGIFEPKRGRT